MFWRHEVLRKNESLSAGVTFRLELPRSGMLGSLLVKVGATDVTALGQDGGAWRPIDFISKFQVLAEGSRVIKSLTGYEVAAIAFWDQGVMNPSRWRNYATNTQEEYFLINFGRWHKDGDLGLDLARWNTVEIQVENTFTASYLTGVTISVEGFFLEDVPASQFVGYMRTEEWRAWTTVSDETKYNELPTDYYLRRIMLQAIPDLDASNLYETNMSNLMDTITLSLDTGKLRVFDGSLATLMRENHFDIGRPVITGGLLYANVDKGNDFSAGYGLYRAGISGSKDGAVSTVVPTLKADENNGTQTAEGYEADSPIEIINVGLAPFHTALLRFDNDYNPSTWLNPDQRKTVKLDIHTRSGATYADGRNAIVLDRFVQY